MPIHLTNVSKRALIAALALVACGGDGDPDSAPVSEDSNLTGARIVVTASSVEALSEGFAFVTPPVKTAGKGVTPESFLASSSALGPLGPLGAFGPLGVLGPIGDASWNVSVFMSAVGDWTKWRKDMIDGPLSNAGPLGENGPLSPAAYKSLGLMNDWAKQLQAGGVFTALGPLGPLGALGPLGPLGPVGAHGFEPNDAGDYMDGGKIVRTFDVPFGAETRTYELVEAYTEARAKQIKDNDTSFMVKGSIDSAPEEVDAYKFTSKDDQFVTIVVVPENSISDFDVEVLDGTKVIAKSDSDGRQNIFLGLEGHYIDFVQARVSKGAKLTARITAKTTPVFKTYRLIVTGSTKAFVTTDIKGPHQKSL